MYNTIGVHIIQDVLISAKLLLKYPVLYVPQMMYNTMNNRRPEGRMRPSTYFDPALIHFSELTHIKLTSYDLRKTHHVLSHQGLFCDSSKFDYRFKTLFSLLTNLKGEACPRSGGVRTTVCRPRTLWRH
jgi:hypothetical protein